MLISPGISKSYSEIEELEIVNLIYLPEKLAIPRSRLRELPGYIAFFEIGMTECQWTHPLHLPEKKFEELLDIVNTIQRLQKTEEPGYAILMNAHFLLITFLLSR